jgi:precorrin-3B synthase
VSPQRRGLCPGILDPMPTGDGLLARLVPSGPLSINSVVALCEASKAHGNGIVEVTQRGSLQFRGLCLTSAPSFARTVIALGVGADGGPPILGSPLMGLDSHESLDLRSLVVALRALLTSQSSPPFIGPKVSVLIDGGGVLHLDAVPGDVRLRAAANSRLHMSMAGTAATSTHLGWVPPEHAAKAIVQLLTRIADRGPDARARDFTNPPDLQVLRASLSNVLSDGSPPSPRPPAEPIGLHPLNTGRLALGIALPFGHVEASVLQGFAQRAQACGATSIQTAPSRSLLVIGLEAAAVGDLAVAAAAAGFLVRPDDPRRFVVACAGAPACDSAKLCTRQLAPAVAEAARPLLDGSLLIHVSGCTKGCAHPGAAALTFVGPNHLIIQGRAGDTPHGTTSTTDFIAGVARLGAEQQRLSAESRSVDFVSRLGVAGVLTAMSAGT